MKFDHNPYYSPDKCGLEILEAIDTADCYEYDMIVVWKKLDDSTLWYDCDSGCSCPSPFDNADNGHDLKPITKDTLYNFEQALTHHRDITKEQVRNTLLKIKGYLK